MNGGNTVGNATGIETGAATGNTGAATGNAAGVTGGAAGVIGNEAGVIGDAAGAIGGVIAWHGPPIAVVGIGADGWPGLGEPARAAIAGARVLMGSARQLALVPHTPAQSRLEWPSPLVPALRGILRAHSGNAICVLASGDPMFYGIGSTLVRLLGAQHVRVIGYQSSAAIACARLGWPAERVEVVRVLGHGAGQKVGRLHRVLHPDQRILVLSADATTPHALAEALVARGYGASEMTVLEGLGGPAEKVLTATAEGWTAPAIGPLNMVAIQCRPGPDAAMNSLVPGLPDESYDHDGQLTKREIRSVTLAALAPAPGQLLWDVGAGAGSIAIEWARSHQSCRAIAIEEDPARAARIAANASALGVPDVRVVIGTAPEALSGLEAPDAVFAGGGVSVPGMIERCWESVRPGGRLVVNAVTLGSERVVADCFERYGGDLTRLAVQRAAPIGGFLGWRPMAPVTQWAVTKPVTREPVTKPVTREPVTKPVTREPVTEPSPRTRVAQP